VRLCALAIYSYILRGSSDSFEKPLKPGAKQSTGVAAPQILKLEPFYHHLIIEA